MEENNKNMTLEDSVNIHDEAIIKPFVDTAEDTPVEEETETPVTEEETTEQTKGLEVEDAEGNKSTISPEAVGAFGQMLGSAIEAQQNTNKVQSEFSDALKAQKDIFESMDTDIEEMKTVLEETKASLTATKMYTQLLTKMILATDAIFAIVIILILIFK